MNKITFAFISFLLFSFAGFSQEPVHIGFKGGLNFASVVGGDAPNDISGRIGFHAGFLAEFYVSRSFGVQGELMFSEQGFRFDEDVNGDGSEEEIQVNLNYINIPVLAKYYITDNFTVAIGPQIGVNIGAQQEIINSPVGAGNEREDLDIFETFDFSGVVGLEYKSNDGFFGQLRGTLGAISVFKAIDGLDNDTRNLVIQISGGFRF